MHHDGLIKDCTTEIKEERGPYDVGLCPLFASDIDASGASDPHRTDERRRDWGIVGSWPMTLTRSPTSIGLHRIRRPEIFADFLL